MKSRPIGYRPIALPLSYFAIRGTMSTPCFTVSFSTAFPLVRPFHQIEYRLSCDLGHPYTQLSRFQNTATGTGYLCHIDSMITHRHRLMLPGHYPVGQLVKTTVLFFNIHVRSPYIIKQSFPFIRSQLRMKVLDALVRIDFPPRTCHH